MVGAEEMGPELLGEPEFAGGFEDWPGAAPLDDDAGCELDGPLDAEREPG